MISVLSYVCVCMCEWVNEWVSEWVSEWVCEWASERASVCVCVCVCVCEAVYLFNSIQPLPSPPPFIVTSACVSCSGRVRCKLHAALADRVSPVKKDYRASCVRMTLVSYVSTAIVSYILKRTRVPHVSKLPILSHVSQEQSCHMRQ